MSESMRSVVHRCRHGVQYSAIEIVSTLDHSQLSGLGGAGFLIPFGKLTRYKFCAARVKAV